MSVDFWKILIFSTEIYDFISTLCIANNKRIFYSIFLILIKLLINQMSKAFDDYEDY